MPFPFAPDFNRALVTLLFRSRVLLPRIRPMLAAHLWADPAETLVARVVLEHYDKYRTPPVAAEVLEALRVSQSKDERPGFEYGPARSLVEHAHEDTAPDEAAMEEKVRGWAVDMAFRVVLTKNSLEQHYQDGDYAGIVAKLRDALAYGGQVLEFVDYSVGIDERIDRYTKGQFKVKPIPTFSPTFTSYLRGGYGRGELMVYLGLSGVGKTQLLVNDGIAAIQTGHKVWVHSCEVGIASYLMRFDQRLTQRGSKDIRMEDGALLRSCVGGGQLRITHSHEGTMQVQSFAAELDRMAPEARPDLFLCDYLQLLRPGRERDQPHIELTNTARELRNLGGEYGMGVVTAIQGNRSGMETKRRGQGTDDLPKVLNFGHMAGAFDVGGVADQAASLNIGPMEEDMKRGRLAILKAREGVSGGVINLIVDHEKSLIKEED